MRSSKVLGNPKRQRQSSLDIPSSDRSSKVALDRKLPLLKDAETKFRKYSDPPIKSPEPQMSQFQTPPPQKKRHFRIRSTPLKLPELGAFVEGHAANETFYLTNSGDGKKNYSQGSSGNHGKSSHRLEPLPPCALVRDPSTGEFTVKILPEKRQNTEEDEIIKDKIDRTMEVTRVDEMEQEIVGEEAIKNFQYHYKNIDKIIRENKIYNIKNSLTTNMLQQIKEDNLPPRKIGVFKPFGDKGNINLNYHTVDEKYAKILSNSIKQINDVKTVKLVSTGFSQTSATEFFSALERGPNKLILKSNQIGRTGVESMSRFLSGKECQLKELNLEGNKLTDFILKDLFVALTKNRSLSKLNLSENFITQNSGPLLLQMLSENEFIDELYLHWNQINGDGGFMIAQGLEANENLKVVDLSWNALGSTNKECAKAFGRVLKKKNKLLVHLDLSFNKFSLAESQIIQKDLAENHSIFGFHFAGNYGYVDEKGYLTIPEDFRRPATLFWKPKLRIQGVKPIPESLKKSPGYKSTYPDVCWICDGWQDVTFELRRKKKDIELQFQNVSIHFETENFQGLLMEKSDMEVWSLRRVFPPGLLRFFFGVDGSYYSTPQLPQMAFEEIYVKDAVLNGRALNDIFMPRINFVKLDQDNSIIDQSFYSPLTATFPRTSIYQSRSQTILVNEEPSLVNKSIEKSALVEVISKVREKDIEGTFDSYLSRKSGALVKEVCKQQEIAEHLENIYRSNYQTIYLIFMALAAAAGERYGTDLKQEDLLSYLSHKKMLDEKQPGFAKLFQKKSAKAKAEDKVFDLESFFEIMLLCAKRLYKDKPLDEAFSQFSEQFLLESEAAEIQRVVRVQVVRVKESLMNIDCERLFKKFEPALRKIHSEISHAEDGLFLLQALVKLLRMGNYLGEGGVSLRDVKEAYFIFADLGSSVDFETFFLILTRIADIISPFPHGFKNVTTWCIEKNRQRLPLYVKLEAVFYVLVRVHLEEDFIESLNLPATSMFQRELEELVWSLSSQVTVDNSPVLTVSRRDSVGLRYSIADVIGVSLRVNGKIMLFEKPPEVFQEKIQDLTDDEKSKANTISDGMYKEDDDNETIEAILESDQIL